MNVEQFYTFMRERESIRMKRAAASPPPWTDDPILQKYKFTNVKREHDRTSRLLREEFYSRHTDDDPAVVLLNCAIARYFGTIEFMRAVGWQRNFNPEKLRRIANTRAQAGERVFTGAYIITNAGIHGSKIDVVIDRFLADLWKQRKDVVAVRNSGSWREFVERLQQVYGFGGTGFLAKEVTLDAFFTNFWRREPVDKNTWTPVGPGSMRGAARVVGTGAKQLNKENTLKVCIDVFAQRGKFWPKKYVELELTDIQFQLCEFSKYEKVRLGEGRPRSLFTPTEN
jgi:hypothetical protein